MIATGRLKKKAMPKRYIRPQSRGGACPPKAVPTPTITLKNTHPTMPMKNQMTPQYIGLIGF
jgi:hypothetical protein